MLCALCRWTASKSGQAYALGNKVKEKIREFYKVASVLFYLPWEEAGEGQTFHLEHPHSWSTLVSPGLVGGHTHAHTHMHTQPNYTSSICWLKTCIMTKTFNQKLKFLFFNSKMPHWIKLSCRNTTPRIQKSQSLSFSFLLMCVSLYLYLQQDIYGRWNTLCDSKIPNTGQLFNQTGLLEYTVLTIEN